MMAVGVVLSNSRDVMTAFDSSKHDVERAKTAPESLNRNHIRDSGAVSPIQRFTYRKAKARGPASIGHYLPAILPGGEAALRAWMEGRLGPLVRPKRACPRPFV